MIYFISDTHFNHKGSLNWPNGKARPFHNVEDMNQYIIENWNKIVKDEDTVYFIGDFAYKSNINKAELIFQQLKGKKHLIIGNHDNKIACKFKNCWESISDIKYFTYEKIDFVLCHYPMKSWKNSNRGSIHLHGHTHGSLQKENEAINRYDCSVEVIDYTPISIEQIINIKRKQ
jgi:calcineurin-like phosphoesterase family protein